MWKDAESKSYCDSNCNWGTRHNPKEVRERLKDIGISTKVEQLKKTVLPGTVRIS